MCRIVVLFLLFVLCFGLHQFDAITFNMNLGPLQLGGLSYERKTQDAIRAFANKPLHIIVGKYKFSDVKCYAGKQTNSQFDVQHKCDAEDRYIIQVPKVTNEMSTKWWCDIKECTSSVKPFNLTFAVHVIGAELPKLTIGGKYLNITLTNSTTTQYDGIVYYTYKDGDHMDLQCECSNTSVSLSYYDSNVRKNEQTNFQNIVKFRKQLSTENHGDEINCTIKTSINSYVYKIVLQLNQPERLIKQNKTTIAMYSVGAFILALFVLAVYLFWRQRTPKVAEDDKINLVSVSDNKQNNSKLTDITHEILNNDLYAISLKKLEQRKNTSDGDPIYNEPKTIIF